MKTPNWLDKILDLEIPFTKKTNGLKIHEDLTGLLWFADGPLRNYDEVDGKPYTFKHHGIEIVMTAALSEEPSLIYTRQAIEMPQDISSVPIPDYNPSYSELTPQQKGVYAKLLENPYNPEIDIGFVFILYYGLERFLLCGDFDKAANVILKLRNVHKNESFQKYSADALVLVGLMKDKTEFIKSFVDSCLDNDDGVPFCSTDLFLMFCYKSKIPITPKIIMNISSKFDFINKNYIKKYPSIFEEKLSKILAEKYGNNEILISRILDERDISELPERDIRVFANMSIQKNWIPMKYLSESQKLKDEMKALLVAAHESTKSMLAEMRKNGEKLPEITVANKKPARKRELPYESSEKSENPVGIKLTGERLQQEQKKITEIVDRTIADIAASGYFKAEVLPSLFEKIRDNTRVGSGFTDPFDNTDCLTLEEKKALGLYTRMQYSRELINSLTKKGLSADNPNDLLENIFMRNFHRISNKYRLEELKELGLRYVIIEPCGDERDCSAVKHIKKRWSIDEVPELPLPNCKADYCRCCYLADFDDLLD